jgi:hypothetical protein
LHAQKRRGSRYKVALFVVLALLAGGLVACAAASDLFSEDGPIQPGNTIEGILVTTAEPGEATFTWDLECGTQGSEEEFVCHPALGTPINVSMGVFDSTLNGKLDQLWADHTYEMWLNDRPVDLAAFGPVDLVHPHVGPMRAWNVVLLASEPGTITVHGNGVVNNDAFEDTSTYTFDAT